MTTFDFIQSLISELRDYLDNNNLDINDDITISYIYREFDVKDIDNNYIEVSYNSLKSIQTNTGDIQELEINFDIIAENPIICEKISSTFKTKVLDSIRFTDSKIPLKTYYNMGVGRIDNNKYIRRISAKVIISNCFS